MASHHPHADFHCVYGCNDNGCTCAILPPSPHRIECVVRSLGRGWDIFRLLAALHYTMANQAAPLIDGVSPVSLVKDRFGAVLECVNNRIGQEQGLNLLPPHHRPYGSVARRFRFVMLLDPLWPCFRLSPSASVHWGSEWISIVSLSKAPPDRSTIDWSSLWLLC